jgi:hypothetical protein
LFKKQSHTKNTTITNSILLEYEVFVLFFLYTCIYLYFLLVCKGIAYGGKGQLYSFFYNPLIFSALNLSYFVESENEIVLNDKKVSFFSSPVVSWFQFFIHMLIWSQLHASVIVIGQLIRLSILLFSNWNFMHDIIVHVFIFNLFFKTKQFT